MCAETFPSQNNGSEVPDGVQPNTILCPVCRSATVTGLHLFGLPLDDIEKAVALKKMNIKKPKPGSKKESTFDMGFEEIQAETSYLLASHSQSGGLSSNNETQRTGRWTDEEIAFVDFVLEAYDTGKFSMPHGVKLNEFLCDLLLCKSSRLTKKMKNAKLSIRSYKLMRPSISSPVLDVEMMSSLQERFLQSVNKESTKLELRFNMSKMWRSHFSNLCLQVGCGMLDASDWIASLEDMEQRASQAEEKIRKARRRRMGEALKTDSRVASNGVFFAGMPIKRPESSKRVWTETDNCPKRAKTEDVASIAGNGGSSATLSTSVTDASTTHSVASNSDEGSEADFIQTMLEMGAHQADLREHAVDDDFTGIFDDFHEEASDQLAIQFHPKTYHHVRNNCGAFLEEIASYMENNNLPFEHADVFVPSYPPKGQGQEGEIRLFHAGHVTRSDLDPSVFSRVHEYGEYSVKFSFASGVGLPGRVYASGEPSWEGGIDEADPTFFKRAGGAKVYGIKTGLGIPLTTAVIGRIVVSMYSTQLLQNEPVLARKIMTDLAQYAPEPKWQLVVDMAGSKSERAQLVSSASMPVSRSNDLMHFDHTVAPGSSLQSVGRASLKHRDSVLSQESAASHRSSSINDEHIIATLLGDHMPLSQIPGAASSFSHDQAALLENFMSLRLLLLRSSEKRSADENEMLDVIGNSFRGYRQREDKEVAFLLANDWRFLKASVESKKPAARLRDEYQSHVMGAPTVNTYSSAGTPAVMPSTLSYMDPSKVSISKLSKEGKPRGSKHRVSAADEAEATYQGFNLVDEN